MAAILPHARPAVKSFFDIFIIFSHLSRFPQLVEELWRWWKPIDQTTKIWDNNIVERERKQNREAHNRLHIGSADCEESVKLLKPIDKRKAIK